MKRKIKKNKLRENIMKKKYLMKLKTYLNIFYLLNYIIYVLIFYKKYIKSDKCVYNDF